MMVMTYTQKTPMMVMTG